MVCMKLNFFAYSRPAFILVAAYNLFHDLPVLNGFCCMMHFKKEEQKAKK